MIKFAIYAFTFASGGLFSYDVGPLLYDVIRDWQEKKAEDAQERLRNVFIDIEKRKLVIISLSLPVILGVLGIILLQNLLGLILGLGVGFLLPSLWLRYYEAMRKQKFFQQLVDALMILSNSLKGGLSLLQAIESVVEEMPAPIKQEFGMVLKENRLGVSLEESLERLNKRMEMDELVLLTSAILVGRETGGDLTTIFGRLVTTIRDRNKIQQTLKSMTLQGKLQGMIMSLLPVLFAGFAFTFNRDFFMIMLQSQTGRLLLGVAVLFEVIGLFLIRKISKVDV